MSADSPSKWRRGKRAAGELPMKVCYLDCFSGIAGDMLLGALIDAGLELDYLSAEIEKLRLDGIELRAEKAKRGGLAGTDFTVRVAHDRHHRSLSTIERIIAESDLSDAVKEDARKIFRKLGEAEALAHDVPVEKVHFHEVGALDAIVVKPPPVALPALNSIHDVPFQLRT